jgi:hypothetical protein
MRTMLRCGSTAGAGCMPSPNSMPSGERDKRAPSCAGRSSAWRWSVCPNRPKCPCRSGSGGADQSVLIWQPSGASTWPGARSSTPCASANRSGSWTTPKLRSPEAAGPLDLAGDSRLCPTAPGPSPRRGSSPARAGTASGGETDARSRPAGLCAAAADGGLTGVRTKTLWMFAWTSQRAALQTGQAGSGDQSDRVIAPKPSLRHLSPAFRTKPVHCCWLNAKLR